MLAVQLPHDARPLDTIREAALHAKVSRRTIYNWMRDGKVDWVRTAGGSVRIYRDTLWRDKDDTPRSPRRLITMDLGL